MAVARKVLEAREEYIAQCTDKPFFAAADGEQAVGFLCLKETGRQTAEPAVMNLKKAEIVFYIL